MVEKMKIFFTSDTHYNHSKILLPTYCNRPFSDVEEMNETMIANWNRVVAPRDRVYHLGDFCFGQPESFLKRLNGYKILIYGNHDRYSQGKAIRSGFREVYSLKEIKIQGVPLIMCHFPMYSWNKSHRGSLHIHGHIHEKLIAFRWNRYNVGVDTNNFTPVESDQLFDIFMQQKEEKELTCDVFYDIM